MGRGGRKEAYVKKGGEIGKVLLLHWRYAVLIRPGKRRGSCSGDNIWYTRVFQGETKGGGGGLCLRE